MTTVPATGSTAAKAATRPAKTADEESAMEATRAPITEHLTELRNRLLVAVAAIVVCALIGFFFTRPLLDLLLTPFSEAAQKAGRDSSEAVFTAPLELLMLQLKLSVVMGIAGGFPVIAWQVWGFVAPGLYKHERQTVLPFILAIPVLFAAGAAMVYFVMLPIVMQFSFAQEFVGKSTKVVYLPKIKEYYELAISLFTGFGLAFQLPVVLSLLAKADIVTSSGLRKGRRYAVVGIFFVAMILTPPDPFSQTILAVPMWVLYELSILSAWLIERARRKQDAAREAATPA